VGGCRGAQTHDDGGTMVVVMMMMMMMMMMTMTMVDRFSKDTYTIDETLMPSIYMFLNTATSVLGTLLTIAYVSPWFLAAVIPPLILYYVTQVTRLTALNVRHHIFSYIYMWCVITTI
jgi:hypothetical protein